MSSSSNDSPVNTRTSVYVWNHHVIPSEHLRVGHTFFRYYYLYILNTICLYCYVSFSLHFGSSYYWTKFKKLLLIQMIRQFRRLGSPFFPLFFCIFLKNSPPMNLKHFCFTSPIVIIGMVATFIATWLCYFFGLLSHVNPIQSS